MHTRNIKRAILHIVFYYLALPCLAQITVTSPIQQYGLESINNVAAISANGARFATATVRGMAYFWDAQTGARLASVKASNGYIETMALSPDGSKALTVRSSDSEGRLWDTLTGQLIRTFSNPNQGINAAFLPDGSGILLGAIENHVSVGKILDVQTGERLKTFGEFGWHAVISPDGSKIACPGNTTSVWDAETGARIRSFTVEYIFNDDIVPRTAWAAAFSPDAAYLLTGNIQSYAYLWDIGNNQLLKTFRLPGDNSTVRAVAYSPNGSQILTGNDDGKLRLWDIATTTCLRTYNHQPYFRVLSVGFSPDGQRILSASSDDTLRVWDTTSTSAALLTIAEHAGSSPYSIAFSPDAEKVVTCSLYARIWDKSSGNLIRCLVEHPASSASFSSDGSKIVTGGENVYIWETATGKILKEFPFPGYDARFSPDGSEILADDGDNNARLWDVESGQLLQTFSGHTKDITSVAFSPDGAKVVTSSYDKTARIWETATGQCLTTLTGYVNVVYCATFSPDGTKVLTGGWNEARLWDASTGQTIRTLLSKTINSADFSPDGSKAILGDGSSRAYLCEVETGRLLKTIVPRTQAPAGSFGLPCAVAYSPDGEHVLVAPSYAQPSLWPVADPTTPTLSTNWTGYR